MAVESETASNGPGSVSHRNLHDPNSKNIFASAETSPETSTENNLPVLYDTTERRLMTKVDLRIQPLLCIMYLLAFLDRVNIGNARLFGLERELRLIDSPYSSSTKYNTALVIFFIPYCLFEIPSNMLLKKFKPHIWLSINMFLFGFVTIMQGLVTNYAGLLVTRFFLGLFEASIVPGCKTPILWPLDFDMWYKRSESQKRFSFFYSSTALSGAFGGLLAAAIGKMDGLAGYRGWRWIFIIEGAVTAFVSIFVFCFLPDFPEDAKWLSEQERTFITARLRADQGENSFHRPIKLRDVLDVLKDPKIIFGGFAFIGIVVPAYSFAYFAPSILRSFQYGAIQTQLRSVPPWAVGFVFAMIIAYVSDRIRHRFWFTIVGNVIVLIGLAMLMGIHNQRNIQYGALFLLAAGAFTSLPVIVCWFNMNLRGHHRRAIGGAWQNSFGNTGGIIAVYIFLERDRPRYIPGYSVSFAFIVLSTLSCCAYGFLCWRSNKRLDKLSSNSGKSVAEEDKSHFGRDAPSDRYML